MSTIFVQGASRGIGYAFVKAFLRNPKNVVFASGRTANERVDSKMSLVELKNDFPNLELITMDVTEENDIIKAAQTVKNYSGKLELLLNCSAMLHPTGKGETKLGDVKPEFMHQTFALNTFGPLLMAKHFEKLLKKGNGSIGSQKFKEHKDLSHCGVIANLSARIGSIEDNRLGGWYAYRMSKTALNMANKCLSIELARGKKRVVTLNLHPGTVDTNLTRPYHKGIPKDKLFGPDHSVEMLLKVIGNACMENTGGFFAYDGEIIKW